MLIKNEISFGGTTAHNNYGFPVMICVYVLSLLVCALLVIALLKLIICCVFTDKYNYLFCVRSDRPFNSSSSGQESSDPSESSAQTSVQSLQSNQLRPKIYRFDEFFVKLTESQFETKHHCVCPICANGHLSMAAITANYGDSDAPKVAKRSSFISRRAKTLSQTLVFNRGLAKEVNYDKTSDKKSNGKESTDPIVSQSPSDRIVLRAGDRPMAHIKRIANYSDVVLELKQKFADTTLFNSVV